MKRFYLFFFVIALSISQKTFGEDLNLTKKQQELEFAMQERNGEWAIDFESCKFLKESTEMHGYKFPSPSLKKDTIKGIDYLKNTQIGILSEIIPLIDYDELDVRSSSKNISWSNSFLYEGEENGVVKVSGLIDFKEIITPTAGVIILSQGKDQEKILIFKTNNPSEVLKLLRSNKIVLGAKQNGKIKVGKGVISLESSFDLTYLTKKDVISKQKTSVDIYTTGIVINSCSFIGKVRNQEDNVTIERITKEEDDNSSKLLLILVKDEEILSIIYCQNFLSSK